MTTPRPRKPPMKETMTLGLVQHACNHEPSDNIKKSIEGVRSAAQQGANLVLLPELHSTRYFCQQELIDNFAYAETIPGPTSDRFSQLAAELDIVIVASIFECRAPGLYHNTAVVFDGKRGLIGKYRKMHIPDDPDYYEKYYFTPGDYESEKQGFQPINTSVGRLGIMVCWDQWFPEAARLMTLAGAELLLYPTAIGWDPQDTDIEKEKQCDAWLTVQRSHAICNGLPVAACNRIGFEPGITTRNTTNTPPPKAPFPKEIPAQKRNTPSGIQFWGSSFIAGPQGEIIALASDKADEIVVAKLDLTHSETVRQTWPFLRDRRIDAYGGLLKRYRD